MKVVLYSSSLQNWWLRTQRPEKNHHPKKNKNEEEWKKKVQNDTKLDISTFVSSALFKHRLKNSHLVLFNFRKRDDIIKERL
tara:strand:+ start:288 stop:533 length:246 start_codon:yes stop_codon:yes gene_type:complete